MADPAYVAVGTSVHTGTRDAGIVVPLPAGWAAGQTAVMIAVTSNFGTDSVSPTLVNPSGWIQLGAELHADGFANTRNPRLRTLVRTLQAGDSAPTVSMTGGDDDGTGSAHLLAYIFTVSDVATVSANAGTIGDTSAVSVGGITTTLSNTLIAGVVATGNSVTTSGHAVTSPGALTERADNSHTSRVSAAFATGTKVAPGATGNYTATLSGTTPWAGRVLSFQGSEPVSFPFTPILDSFNRADGALGANWSADPFGFSTPSLEIISNQAGSTSGGRASYWSAGTFGPNCEVYVTVATKPADGQRFSLAYRIQSPATTGVDCYVLQISSAAGTDEWKFQVATNQVFTNVGASAFHEIAAGDQVGVKVVGSEHFMYHKPAAGSWTLVTSRTDATHAGAGHVGFDISDTVGRLDNFGAGTLGTTSIPGSFDVPMTVTTLTSLTSWVDITSLATVSVDVPVSGLVGDTVLNPPGEPSGDPQRWALDITDRAGVVVAQFEPQSFRITDTINVGMSMEGIARSEATGAASLSVQERIVRAWRRPGGASAPTERIIRFAGHVHGPLTDTGDENGQEMVQFVARDPFSALAWRLVSSNISYGTEGNDEIDIGVIAADLVGNAVDYEPGVDPFLITSQHGLTVTQIQPSVAGTFAYDRGKQYAEAIMQLTELERGFWFRIEAREGALFGAMRIYYPVPGATRNAARFEYGPKTLANLSSFRVDTQMVVNAVSVFGGNNILVKVFDEDSIDQYGLWEISLTFSDVYDPRALRAYGEEALRPDPVQTFSCEVASGGPAAPMLWDSFNVGDSVPLYIRGERLTVDRMVTVTSATVEVDENGDERLASLVLEAR